MCKFVLGFCLGIGYEVEMYKLDAMDFSYAKALLQEDKLKKVPTIRTSQRNNNNQGFKRKYEMRNQRIMDRNRCGT